MLSSAAFAQNKVGDIGVEAYEAGDYVLAERYLLKAIAYEYQQENATDDDYWALSGGDGDAWHATTKYREVLAHVYWETSRDHKLLDHAEQFLTRDAQQFWWCRVLERRGHNEYAENCWKGEGYDEQTKRTIRTQMLLQSLTPDGTLFGYRPMPAQ